MQAEPLSRYNLSVIRSSGRLTGHRAYRLHCNDHRNGGSRPRKSVQPLPNLASWPVSEFVSQNKYLTLPARGPVQPAQPIPLECSYYSFY